MSIKKNLLKFILNVCLMKGPKAYYSCYTDSMEVKEVKIPIELKYSKDHEWIKMEGDIAIVGITDYAQEKLTDIVFVDFPEIGKEVEQGRNLCVVESVKSVSDVLSPISGEIVEVNRSLEDSPELVNSDPYEGGWIVKIKIKESDEFKNLLTAEEYTTFVTEKE
ncbi:MAG: glycine cleavage system H protein [Candidatus Scalindua sp.]|nr:MAG: glycine cleavage system H protein [Candidatus Scalindua sp.]